MFAFGFAFNPIFLLMHWFSAAVTASDLAMTNLGSLVVLVCLLINDILFTFSGHCLVSQFSGAITCPKSMCVLCTCVCAGWYMLPT